jgi:predicted metallopeptidase
MNYSKLFLNVDPDYVIQFLSDKNTRLPCLTKLIIRYETLEVVTNNFTNNTTRLNCARIKSLDIYKQFPDTKNFHSYFSSLILSK